MAGCGCSTLQGDKVAGLIEALVGVLLLVVLDVGGLGNLMGLSGFSNL